jgi:hypothetical protein
MQVAIGLKAHSGWAVAAVVGRDAAAAPRVVERCRIELVRPQDRPWGKAPYHAAQPLAPEAAHDLVQRAIAGAHAATEETLRGLVQRLRDAGHDVAACAVLAGSPLPAWTTAQILAVHLRMHQAEGALFPAALARAAQACGLRVVEVPQKTLDLDARADALAALGRGIGAPWGQDQKSAAIAAMMALEP